MLGRKGKGNGSSSPEERAREARERLLAEIRLEARETSILTGRPKFSERVLAAMARVPREAFAEFMEPRYAYANAPFPIGFGQTISQPYVVALMTDLLDPGDDDIVFEVGTGSGYQAAVLSFLVKRVYTVEVVPELATQAQERLARLGFDNVTVRHGDGAQGWPEHAPFDAIIVTAAAPRIPPALIVQLKPGGRLLIPLGGSRIGQELVLVEKDENGYVHQRNILPVAFVPLTGGES